VLGAATRGPAFRGRRRIAAAVIVVAGAAAIAVSAARLTDAGPASPLTGGGRFVPSVRGEEAVVWAVGDGANGSREARAVAARIRAGPVDRVLYLGDVYEDGTAREFRDNYATTYGPLARITAPTSGNHDARNEGTGYDPYWRRAHGVRPPDWYATRAAGWTLLGLDSEDPHDKQSAQYRWLRRQLRAPGTCRIAFWHRPRFSAGTHHGDQEDMASLWDALRGRATIVISGHEHDMQRFKPVDGLTQFVSGAGGAELYSLRRDPRLAFGDDRTHGALRLRLRPGAAAYAFVAADGRILDSGTVRCRAST
jgi:3',5'-cyclic AMP phosphodiesterase CpdA